MVNHAQDWMLVMKFFDLPNKLLPNINAYISRKFAAIIRERESNQSDGI